MRRVLEVVPSNMFVLLNDIISVQTRSMKVLPARLERAELREFAQFDERYRLARSTHQVARSTHHAAHTRCQPMARHKKRLG